MHRGQALRGAITVTVYGKHGYEVCIDKDGIEIRIEEMQMLFWSVDE